MYYSSGRFLPPVPPKITPFSFEDGLRETMMTRVICGVSQGDLPINFTWYKDEKRLANDDPWENNIVISPLDSYSTLLRFSSLSAEQVGTYTCLASNPASQTYFSAKLEVQGKTSEHTSSSAY
ncbi:Down syndrome cell adhesion molecule-like protein Dscam2 [Orchesella cincta]|uniref:Down syndrome cell adhesion molecule-like protein Dscam2 n=1 Tax=Orchesella cincta TaxID=48709 RepID=A0A1D2N8Y4_ORCCI|nr:Down syndrome cell adhesion molecule-like protein Dscam2 [Orchesella cincta]